MRRFATGALYKRWTLLALALIAGLMPARPSALGAPVSDAPSRYFPETGYAVSGSFLDYWNARGGLFSFGYPITEPTEENGLQVQYFERARFEYHPENAGTRYEVLLGALGTQLASNRDFVPGFMVQGTTFFAQTGHN